MSDEGEVVVVAAVQVAIVESLKKELSFCVSELSLEVKIEILLKYYPSI